MELQLTCSWAVMTASYSMARMSGPELNMDGAPSRNLSMSLKAAWAPSLDWNLSTSWLASRYAPSSHQVWAWRWWTHEYHRKDACGSWCLCVCRCISQYLSKTKQQLVCLQKTRVFGLKSSVECITVVAKLVAALHNESHGIVVTGWKLVPMKDDDLGSSHHFLIEPKKKQV